MTPEQRQRKNEANRRSRLRAKGYAVPKRKIGRPWISDVPRCPVCGCEISAVKDCRCP